MPGPSILVGLDFGTTFSGVAWALEGSIDSIEVLTSWPGCGNRTSAKVPSLISYTGKDVHWGYQIGPLTKACRGIKLLLDEDQQTKYEPALASKELLQTSGKTPVQAAADYMRQLIRQVQELIERRLGVAIEDTSMQYVLTVPAVWSDKAKDATLRALVEAGVSPLDVSLVSEPEAAALYTMHSIQPNSIAKNDVFIVCDAGGGTVDLISYMVEDLDPLRLTEATEGTGSICGSMLLDCRFRDFLRDRMGHESYDALPTKSKETALLYWQERVKPSFVGNSNDDFDDVDYFIPLPGVPDSVEVPVEGGFLVLTSDNVEAIFEPIVRQVEELIAQQARSISRAGLNCETLLLVGGFGSSDYLFRRLQDANPSMKVIQPPNGWSAVVSGAVHRGLEGNKVQSRIARRNYGVACCSLWDPARHDEKDKHWDPLEEKYLHHGEMQWYIKKHSRLGESEPIRMFYFRTVEVGNEEGLKLRDCMYFCNDDDRPATKGKRTIRLCELEADLSQIPKELFQKKKNSKGVEYWKIPFALTMTTTSASLRFELEFNRVSYGSVTSKY